MIELVLGSERGVTAVGAARAPGRVYVGERSPAAWRVSAVDGSESHPLPARTSDPLRSFSWGRSSASARELAWSMIYDCSRDPRLADDWCAAFCAEVLAPLPSEGFRIPARVVCEWLDGGATGHP